MIQKDFENNPVCIMPYCIKHTFPVYFILFGTFLFLCDNIRSQENNWTHFRGSSLNGIATTDSIPDKWDCSNIKWKTEIHGRGFSSPVVYEDQIWMTTSTEDGKNLYAVCTDFISGKIKYDIRVFSPGNPFSKNSVNTYASSTPCIEKGFLYVHYGSLGTACIKTTDGSIVWVRTDLKCNHELGAGSSPILYRNLLILQYEGTDVQFITALDKLTGKTVWRTSRPGKPYEQISEIGRKSYTTPEIVRVNGNDLMISNGSAVCCAYDPLTGEEIWRVTDGQESAAAMPFTEAGIVYFYSGFMVDREMGVYTDLLAVNPDASGEVTSTKIIWKKRDSQTLTQLLTPIIKDGLIYTITTKNLLMCIDSKTGKELWSVRQKENFNASPVYVNGNIWFFSVKGNIIVLKAGRRYEIVAQNKTDQGVWATPAFLRNSILLRTEKYLYRIGW
jgi:outer membrane protein assembly factor BamB